MRTHKSLASAIAVTAFLGLHGESSAQGSPAEGVHEHDGFMLRVSLGLGYATTLEEGVLGEGSEFYGASLSSELSAGGVLFAGLALHGSVWGWEIACPNYYLEGEGHEETISEGSEARLGAFGAGLTYFLIPSNVFLSLMVGRGVLQLEEPYPDPFFPQPEAGTAVRIAAGREWWMSDNWGLGIAGTVDLWHVAATKEDWMEDFDDPAWSGYSVTVGLSATYN